MRKLKIEIPAVLVFIGILICSGEVGLLAARYVIIAIAFVGISFVGYYVVVDSAKAIRDLNIDKDNTLREAVELLSDTVNEYGDKQQEVMKEVAKLLEDFVKIEENQINHIDKLKDCHEALIESEKKATEEFKKISEGIQSNYQQEAKLIKTEFDEAERILRELKNEIIGIMNNYAEILSKSGEAVNVMKVTLTGELGRMNKSLDAQSQTIVSGMENCVEGIEDGFTTFVSKQKALSEEHNKALEAKIAEMQAIVTEKTGTVLEDNQKLLNYIKQVQEEWTTLSRDEIKFLDKVWKE